MNNKRPNPVLPDRFDFAVISVNWDEDEAIRRVLRLVHKRNIENSVYYWGLVRTETPGEEASVVYGSTGDQKGPEAAGALVRKMVELFDPEYFLALGTAGGVNANGIGIGQVVYSRLVRSSSNRGYKSEEIEFEEDSNLPPDDRLTKLADDVARTKTWRSILTRRQIIPPRRIRRYQRPEKVEIFSGPDRHDHANADLLTAIRRNYRRVSTVEMEAAGVAHELIPYVRDGRRLGYIVIKGISDLVDDTTDMEERKTMRKLWAPYTSAASAAFARALITAWQRRERPFSSGFVEIPSKYRRPIDVIPHTSNNKSLVVHRLHPIRYSELSRIYTEFDDTMRVFTVCAFEPEYFIDQIKRQSNTDVGTLGETEFLKIADGIFEHFAAFRRLWEKGRKVTRILLANQSIDEWYRRNQHAIDLFGKLNGGVPCYVAEVPELKKEDLHHMTDHAIFNSSLWLDYYDESQTLILTFERGGPVHAEFTRFERHFEQKAATRLYKPLSQFLGDDVRSAKLA